MRQEEHFESLAQDPDHDCHFEHPFDEFPRPVLFVSLFRTKFILVVHSIVVFPSNGFVCASFTLLVFQIRGEGVENGFKVVSEGVSGFEAISVG